MTHLLVTNDFPPKVGGIQSYLWELWRRLPPESFAVLTTPYKGDTAWDAEQPYRVVRDPDWWLLPKRSLRARVDALAAQIGASHVILDPALPVGAVGPKLALPYGVVLHGSEVTVPGRLPGSRAALGRVLRGAELVIAAGGYPAAEGEHAAGRSLPVVEVPPGVDTERFRPLSAEERAEARRRFGLPVDQPVVLGVSRLVPRKGFDRLLQAVALAARTRPGVVAAIAGGGRDRKRLEEVAAKAGAPVRFLGRVPDGDLPALYGCADVFAMLCRNRWAGLEQEGFGIVFLEAAAAGVPQVAGRSGGAHEAVVHGETGLVVDHPDDVEAVAAALAELLDHPEQARAMGEAARARAVSEFTYDHLAARLGAALAALPS